MLKTDRIEANTLVILTLLIGALLLVNVDMSTKAQPPDTKNLHGPPLTPIHMHSNITLNPIHMHHTNGILWPGEPPITEPNCSTDWFKIYPTERDPPWERWHLSSWEDLGEPFRELSQNDQIDMNNTDTGEVQWFHVDRMTLTLNLSGPFPDPIFDPGPASLLLELKQPYCNPYDPYIVYDPEGTLWHEVWPHYSGVYQIFSWMDNPFNQNGMLDYCDSISFDGVWWYHVEDIATDLILRWKMLNPIGTWWHELYPDYCEWYNMTSWKSFPDPYCDRISPRDLIDMFRISSQTTHWYFVDRVTITINVTDVQTLDWMMLELKTWGYEEMFHAFKKPIGTLWHAVYPEHVYCTVFNLTWWDPMDALWDNCNGVLDPCDHIVLYNMTSGLDARYHITDMAYDIILNEYVTDPIGTEWQELQPDYGEEYEITDFQDNGDLWISPCDNVTLTPIPTGVADEYHVENVTLTLNVTVWDEFNSGFQRGDRIYFENLEGLEDPWNRTWPRLYHPKIEPWDTYWQIKWPTDHLGEIYWIADWNDNCNGVLDYCDFMELYTPDGLSGLILHIEEVAVDITVKKYAEEPPPPPWYKKPPYPDYAPSGMPDFDQKQDRWGPAQGMWTWCGPTAVGNSLWWFDSKYDPSNIVPTFPGSPDDHHVKNVGPLIANLSWWMDTDDQRAPFDGHTGTFWQDMDWGIRQYLIQQGITTLEVHNQTLPDFFWIEEEIERCQDVVLLLEFWFEPDPGFWIKLTDPYDFPGGDGGHYVTAAGVNSTMSELLFSDPFLDAAEQGWPGEVLPSFPHPAQHPSLHNDTQYVSHDAYFIVPWPVGSPYGAVAWEVTNYLQQYMGYPPEYHTFIAAAVVTSPIAGIADVAVANVTSPKTVICQGSSGNITVTVENQGGTAETFNVTLYANTTTIGEKTVALGIGGSTDLIFTWDPTAFSKGNYTLKAVADNVTGEADTADNTYIDSWVIVSMLGDITGPDGWPDGICNMRDVGLVARYFGQYVPPAPANCDVVYDGKIDMRDIGTVARYFGQTDP